MNKRRKIILLQRDPETEDETQKTKMNGYRSFPNKYN